MSYDQLTFPGMPGSVQGPGLPREKPWKGADRRRTQRQADVIDQGGHPLGLALSWPLRLHPRAFEEQRTCGSCRFRELVSTGSASNHPKCLIEKGPYSRTLMDCPYPRVSAGAGTDVRKWWPACEDHEWGDPSLSPDAARSGPAANDTDE